VNLFLSTAIVLASIAVGVTGFLLFRRRAPEGGFFTDGDRAAGVFGVLATGFSVLLGFVIFLAYTGYDDARSGAEQEATDLIQEFETAQLLPRPASQILSGQLICYGRAVAHIEWPRLEAGNPPSFNPWRIPLYRTFQTIVPRTAAEQAAYSKWLDQTFDREQARIDRVKAGRGIIPGPLWAILFVSAGLVITYGLFFVDRDEGKVPQAMIAATLAAMVSTSFLVIRFLDNPYHRGYGSLRPDAIERVLVQIDVTTSELGLVLSIPCDSAGRALS
jgi:hypothetical protein